MTVTVSFYDHENKKMIRNSENFPVLMSHLWEYSTKQARYLPNALVVSVSNGKNSLSFLTFGGYLRCCGMREFGNVDFHYSFTDEGKQALVKEVFDHPWFKQQRIGALLYTKVKDRDGDLHYTDGWDFVNCWPGTVTEGGWWYNPNSGNYCCNVTLSFDADAAAEEDVEEGED